MKRGEKMNMIMIIFTSIFVGVISAFIAAKIIATYYFNIINGFVERNIEMIKDFINWSKEINKFSKKQNQKE